MTRTSAPKSTHDIRTRAGPKDSTSYTDQQDSCSRVAIRQRQSNAKWRRKSKLLNEYDFRIYKLKNNSKRIMNLL